VPGHGVQRELVGLGHLAAAPALQQDVAEVVVHPVVRLELAELERDPVAGRVTDGAEQDLRVLGVALAQQQSEQVRQLGLQHARDAAHRPGNVEEHGDRQGVGVLVAVAALPEGQAVRVEALVRPPVGAGRGGDAIAVRKGSGAGGGPVALGGVVDVGWTSFRFPWWIPLNRGGLRLCGCDVPGDPLSWQVRWRYARWWYARWPAS